MSYRKLGASPNDHFAHSYMPSAAGDSNAVSCCRREARPVRFAEFVDLFEQILEKTYIDKILDYSNEKVIFYKETMIPEDKSEIQSKIVTSSKEIPIYYRMILKDGKWKVYDVVVENVSLVQNYRTQFNEILSGGTPEQLLDTLRKKVKAQ